MVERIHRLGPVSFADYLDLALHGQGGFFASGGSAGRQGHFLTSPEVGPLFGAVLARALDAWWHGLGRPHPFVLVEAGAGTGTLATAVRAAGPACSTALRYVLVERSAALRARQRDKLPLEPPSSALVTATAGEEEAHARVGAGPVFTSLSDMPGHPFGGVVLANELLDNLPVVLLELRDGRWMEVRVGEEGGDLVEVLVPAPPDLSEEAARLAPAAPEGGRIPLQHAGRAWLRDALAIVERGRVVVIDYASTTPSLARRPWQEWLRTYRAHAGGQHPLTAPGTQDVTCELALDQLAAVRHPSAERSQAEFLRAHGLDSLVEAARARWEERAHVGDLDAVRARSVAGEAAALTDPAAFGAFRVLEWEVS